MVGNSHLQSKYFKEFTLQNKINYALENRKFQLQGVIRKDDVIFQNQTSWKTQTWSYFIKKILEEASKSILFVLSIVQQNHSS